MDEPVEILKRALETEQFDEDGDPLHLELFAAMTDQQVEAFQSRLPCDLPRHIRALLKLCRGFEGGIADTVDFSGRLPYAQEEMFPHGLPIASDGFGNFWVVDLHARSTDFEPIYFACHDPPVIALQSRSLSAFLLALLRLEPQRENPIDFVHEEAIFSIWKHDSRALTRKDALASSNRELKELALRAPEGSLIADLRHADTGDGFSWGRFGPEPHIVRHAFQPILAYGPRT